MKATTLTKVAGQSILKNKMRTLLTMLGIIIGVGAVIVMVAIGAGAQGEIARQIQNLGTNMLVVTPGAAEQGGVSQGAQSFTRLTVDDADMLRDQSFLVSAVSPVIVAPTQVIGGAGNWRTAVMGVSTDYQVIRDWGVSDGVFFEQADVRALRKVVLLGATVADALFPDGDAVGQQIRVRDVPVTVVGVLNRKGQTSEGSDQDDVVLAPYTTVQSRLSGRMFISQILASTSSPDDIPGAQEEVRQILRDAHDLSPNEGDDFTVRNQAEITEAAQGTTEVMTLLLAAIAGISLLVGGIGIMNIMLVSVTERTREIGLRLAMGARGSDVLTQFLVESVVMSVLGGLIGLGIGVGGSRTISYFTGWSTMVAPSTVLVALGFAGAVGVFFGFYPARRAASLDPIEALRYE
ncbi:MAG: FtsX-like permease family protein [Gemmatimonadetes bacterium]|nr:FtsX-like permease family protein [Gemmatimonadota bacterium]